MATTLIQTPSYTKNLTLNLDDYPGGVAIWVHYPLFLILQTRDLIEASMFTRVLPIHLKK
ncbi:hypothetical protein PGH46_06445 [Legionella pneumophila]|nr:hypothetical protein PGH46_06445 [Legionella pneumophila]